MKWERLKWDLKVHILKGGAIKMGNLSAGFPAWIGHSPHPLGKHHHYKHLEEDILPLDTFFTGWGRREGEKWADQNGLLSTWWLVAGRQITEMLSKAFATFWGRNKLQLYPLKNPSTCPPQILLRASMMFAVQRPCWC